MEVSLIECLMKRIIIVCEGPTEIEFCRTVLYPYFFAKSIYIQTPLIKKSGGGIVPWLALSKQIRNHLLQDGSAIVTTFIDYYGIPAKFDFPCWAEASMIADKQERMLTLENGMKQSIEDSIRHRFIPYIQLHEFEGLLFCEMETFDQLIPQEDLLDKPELISTIQNNPNPELINDTPDNAPSYRLKRLIRGYNKIVYGALLAENIGLERLRIKCPRFNQWITNLESI